MKSLFFVPEFWKSSLLHMNFVPELFYKRTKFMCKNEHFQSSGTKNELFKVQKRKTKLMYSLRTKTIFWPLRNCSLLNQLSSPTWIACINPIFEPKVMALILWRVQVGILVRIGLRISSLNFFIKGRNSCVKMNFFKV